MSEVLRLPESECARALGMLSQFADGDLAADQSAWLGGHLAECAECRVAQAGFAEIDGQLTGWGQQLGLRNRPPADARAQLAVRLGPVSAGRRAMRWKPVAAAAI